MHRALKINATCIIGYIIGYLLASYGFPYMKIIFGLSTFIIIGLNIAWLFESISGQLLDKRVFLPISILSSLIFTPISLLATYLTFDRVTDTLASGSILILLACTGVALLASFYTRKTVNLTSPYSIELDQQSYVILGAYILFITLNFLLYTYIPEADGYHYINELSSIVSRGTFGSDTNRIMFLALSLGLNKLTSIPFYWLFKIVYPLIVFMVILLPFYSISHSYKTNLAKRYLLAFLPICVPVVAMEILYARPQSIFMIFFVLSNYIYYILGYGKTRYPWLVLCLLIYNLLGLAYHEYFIIGLIVSIAYFAFYFKNYIRNHPITSALLLVLSIIIIYPWIKDTKLLSTLYNYVVILTGVIKNIDFRINFINSYTNTDGNQMGWPGIMSVFYYFYNVGIPLIFLAITTFTRKFSLKRNIQCTWPYYLTLLLFFVIAEILPRMGFCFFPDRAWLFVSLSVCIIILSEADNVKLSLGTVVVLICISLTLNCSLTYMKKGWVTKNEFRASKEIKRITDKDSIIISQFANGPMISYFADRNIVTTDIKKLMDMDKAERLAYINSLRDNKAAASSLENDMQKIEERYSSFSISKIPEGKASETAYQLKADIEIYDKLRSQIDRLKNNTGLHPVYVLYSDDKFTGLYGKRQWWRTYNSYGADLGKIEDDKAIIIFKDNGIVLVRYY